MAGCSHAVEATTPKPDAFDRAFVAVKLGPRAVGDDGSGEDDGEGITLVGTVAIGAKAMRVAGRLTTWSSAARRFWRVRCNDGLGDGPRALTAPTDLPIP